MGTRKRGETYRGHILVDGGGSDLLGRLMKSRIDHLEASIAQGAGDHLGAAVVAIESWLGDQDPGGHAARGYRACRSVLWAGR